MGNPRWVMHPAPLMSATVTISPAGTRRISAFPPFGSALEERNALKSFLLARSSGICALAIPAQSAPNTNRQTTLPTHRKMVMILYPPPDWQLVYLTSGERTV